MWQLQGKLFGWRAISKMTSIRFLFLERWSHYWFEYRVFLLSHAGVNIPFLIYSCNERSHGIYKGACHWSHAIAANLEFFFTRNFEVVQELLIVADAIEISFSLLSSASVGKGIGSLTHQLMENGIRTFLCKFQCLKLFLAFLFLSLLPLRELS